MERNRTDPTPDDQAVTPDPEHAEDTLLGDADDVSGGPEERVDEQLRRERERD